MLSLHTTIGREYDLAASFGFDVPDLLRFTRNGITSSFTSAERKPESTEGGRRVSVLKRQEGAPVNLG